MSTQRSAESDAPRVGDTYTWVMAPGSLVEVLSVGRKYAKVRVTMPNGGSWLKDQPMPFPVGFMRVTPPASTADGDA